MDYKTNYLNTCDCDLCIQSNVAKSIGSLNVDILGFKLSIVSSLFALWSLGDKLSRTYIVTATHQ